MDVVKPGKLDDDEAAAEEADDVEADESVEEAAADAEVCVVFAASDVADLEGDDDVADEAVDEALAVESESFGRVLAAAPETSRIETAKRENDETDAPRRSRMLVVFPKAICISPLSPLSADVANFVAVRRNAGKS